MLIKISSIRIPEEYYWKPPRQEKIEEHMQYYKEHGSFQNPVTITQRGLLTNGFIHYLLACEMGMQSLECTINTEVVSHRFGKNKRIHNKDYKRRALYISQGGLCACCGKQLHIDPDGDKATYMTLDHIFPLSRGGISSMENLQGVCRKCNQEKGNQIDDDIIEYAMKTAFAWHPRKEIQMDRSLLILKGDYG